MQRFQNVPYSLIKRPEIQSFIEESVEIAIEKGDGDESEYGSLAL